MDILLIVLVVLLVLALAGGAVAHWVWIVAVVLAAVLVFRLLAARRVP